MASIKVVMKKAGELKEGEKFSLSYSERATYKVIKKLNNRTADIQRLGTVCNKIDKGQTLGDDNVWVYS